MFAVNDGVIFEFTAAADAIAGSVMRITMPLRGVIKQVRAKDYLVEFTDGALTGARMSVRKGDPRLRRA